VDYTITHTTHYSYTSPVSVCQNIVTLTPREDGRVRCLVNRLRVKPTPVNTHRRNDFFGNIHTIFSIDENHDDLTISAVSRVTVQSQECSETQRFEATKGVGNQASQTDWQTVSRYLSQQILPDWYKISSFFL
jgi:transglutaminase-like putative cysteine protease